MKNNPDTKIFLIILFFFGFSSCRHFSNNIRNIQYLTGENSATIKNAHIILDTIEVKRDFDCLKIQANAYYIFKMFLSAQNNNYSKNYLLSAVFKENKILKKNYHINSITLELTIIDSSNSNPIVYLIISEETPDTLASYSYLYKLIEKGFSEVLK